MRLRSVFIIAVCAFVSLTAHAQPTSAQLLELFPDRLDSFQRVGQPRTSVEDFSSMPTAFDFSAGATYIGSNGEEFVVVITRYHQDAEAYSRLTLAAQRESSSARELVSEIGTAGFIAPNEVAFFKGRTFIRVWSAPGKKAANSTPRTTELARLFATRTDTGEGEIPVLIKHLPRWEQAQKNVVFLSRFKNTEALIDQPALSAVAPEGDADAALATYGTTKVLLIEFNTPQLATENDQHIIGRIHELWDHGLPAPSAYRRVGNYSVFVFDAPDERSAKQLIDEVKYEQVVQWLGENPYILKEAERRYVETTLGVFVAVVKASGVALVGCLGLGGLFGALLFRLRRAQQREAQAYSDAGGMLRLNIDELTPQTDPARLIQERN